MNRFQQCRDAATSVSHILTHTHVTQGPGPHCGSEHICLQPCLTVSMVLVSSLTMWIIKHLWTRAVVRTPNSSSNSCTTVSLTTCHTTKKKSEIFTDFLNVVWWSYKNPAVDGRQKTKKRRDSSWKELSVTMYLHSVEMPNDFFFLPCTVISLCNFFYVHLKALQSFFF